jgi:hypothetical protein
MHYKTSIPLQKREGNVGLMYISLHNEVAIVDRMFLTEISHVLFVFVFSML